MPEEEPRRLQARIGKNGQTWEVWCRYCRKWHIHGPSAGHRVAHCERDTPYSKTGYVLIEPIPDRSVPPGET